ncbi:MAG: hypothetical protein ACI9SY_000133 [Candidatus Paceibacteria bacterium]|jgi:hypothetical protein
MKYLYYSLFILFLTPVRSFAQSGCEGSIDAAQGCGQGGGAGLEYSLESPLRSNITTVESLLTTILNVLLVIAVPIIVFFIIFAGFTYVTAQGNPEKIKTATRSITYAIIGGVLILGGVAISEIIASVVSSFQS